MRMYLRWFYSRSQVLRSSEVEDWEQRSLKNKLGANEIMLSDHIEHLPNEITTITGRVLLASTESGLAEL